LFEDRTPEERKAKLASIGETMLAVGGLEVYSIVQSILEVDEEDPSMTEFLSGSEDLNLFENWGASRFIRSLMPTIVS
jgi:hypothetical protein